MFNVIASSKTFKCFLIAVSIFVTWIVFNIRSWAGPDLAVSPLFLLPIALVSVFVGKWAGVVLSVVCAATLLFSDLMLEQHFAGELLMPVINEILRLILFVSTAIGLAELRAALEREQNLARLDYLTEIGNRRLFSEAVQREIERGIRYKHSFSIAYVDIDNFKNINDLLGHQRGDDFLILIALALKKNTRKTDVVARLGGDEFGVLFPETESEAALRVASKLQKQFDRLAGKMNYRITFSFGVATFITPPKNTDIVLKKADELMYKAKRAGKNQIKSEIIKERRL